MVVLKRRARTIDQQDDTEFSASVPYGIDEHGPPPPLSAISLSLSPPASARALFSATKNKISGWSPGQRFSYEYGSSKRSYQWLVKLFCVLGCLSSIFAYRTTSRARVVTGVLESQQMALKLQTDETFATLKDAREGLKSLRSFVDGLKRTQDALYHEIRMVNEMFEAESAADMPASPARGSSDNLVEAWMQHRQDALFHKIKNLKEFIQQESREEVIKR